MHRKSKRQLLWQRNDTAVEIKIEELRREMEEAYREDDPNAIAVVEQGDVDYDNCPTIKEYENKGYRFIDANAFGFGSKLYGEILLFTKKE